MSMVDCGPDVDRLGDQERPWLPTGPAGLRVSLASEPLVAVRLLCLQTNIWATGRQLGYSSYKLSGGRGC